MRAPIPFVAPPMPVVASPVIRDDVALDAIAPATWDALAGSQPFLTHAFLTALHATGCAVPRTGWKPQYLTAWREHELIGALPLYAKAHSYGEYVFDWGWAEAYRRHGRRYYPKLLAAIPFTPVPGPRVLSPDASVRRALLEYALEAVRRGMFSSLHVLFPPAAEAAEGQALGMIPRQGVQFHWINEGYRDFTDFLAAFSHDKRKKVKQERRKLAAAGVTFERKRGRAITSADWAFFYQCYEATYRAHHSTPYLTHAFFEAIGARSPIICCLRSARARVVRCARRSTSSTPTRCGAATGAPPSTSPGCTSRRATTRPSNSASSNASPGSKAARRACTSSRADCAPSRRYSLHAVGDREFAAAIADFCMRERLDVAHSLDELESSYPFAVNR